MLPAAALSKREPLARESEGAVIITESPNVEGRLLVCVVLDDAASAAEFDGLIVAPISGETRYASEWDLLLEADDSPLGYPLMVEVWNHGTLLREQIVERCGLVVLDGQRRLAALYKAALGDEVELPDGRGVPILTDEDPRALFQDEEAERAAAFWEPAARLLAEADDAGAPSAVKAATIGSLLNRWLEAQGYTAVEYAHELTWQAVEVEAICNDQIDPRAVTAERLAELFARPRKDLRELDEDDLGKALSRSLRDDDFAHVGAHGGLATYGRSAGVRGVAREVILRARGTSQPATPDERAQRKKSYIQEFLVALEEKSGV